MKIQQALAGLSRVLLDTAPVIYHVQGAAAYQPLMDYAFQQAGAGAVVLCTTPITLAECLVKPFQLADVKLIAAFRDLLTNGAETQFVGIDQTAEQAAELRARYKLQLSDAFQVAAALKHHCDGLLTNDAAFKAVQEVKILFLDDLEL